MRQMEFFAVVVSRLACVSQYDEVSSRHRSRNEDDDDGGDGGEANVRM